MARSRLQVVERARVGEAFQRLLVDGARIDAPRQIRSATRTGRAPRAATIAAACAAPTPLIALSA